MAILTDLQITGRIAANQLITDHDAANIQNCAYVLRAGKAFEPETGNELLLNAMNGDSRRVAWEIGPTETLVVRTTERVRIPNDLCASYTPLHRLSSQGLMLLNPSVVEPGYDGRLSCFLVNFSSQRITVQANQKIAKIVFHELTAPVGNLQAQTIPDAEYEGSLADAARKFHRSFMDIIGLEQRAAEKAKEAVRNSVIAGGVLVGLLLLWASLEPLTSKWLWEKTGVYTATQRTEDTKLLKDSEASQAQLKLLIQQVQQAAENSQMRLENEKLKRVIAQMKLAKP